MLPDFVNAPFVVVRYCVLHLHDLVQRKDRISFFQPVEMLNVLYILEALRCNCMTDFYLDEPERIKSNCLIFFLSVKMLNVRGTQRKYSSKPLKHSIRGGEWYLEKRGSRKILAGSRNLGSVFDKSRSLVFAWLYSLF